MTKVREDNGHWRCGIPSRQQIPGLMLGLAGIGYQLLRLYNRTLPSVLMMEGPVSHEPKDVKQFTHQDRVEMAFTKQQEYRAEPSSEPGQSYA
ncbi:hypothetical protein D3C74_362180 [compost metagenome]